MTPHTRQPGSSCADPESRETLTVAAARELILSGVTPIPSREHLPLQKALGRILAEDLRSPMDVPGHTNSAMDGYALAGSELQRGSREFKIVGTAYAGTPWPGRCGPGECVRIMTGAPMPAGTDSVVMQEKSEKLGDERIRIGEGQRYGQNVRLAGEDIAKGATVLRAGRRLIPADLGILASLGLAEVGVFARPRVAFFSTGDELRGIGEPLEPGELYDSNRYTLNGMLQRAGAEGIDLGVVKDDPETLDQAFREGSRLADVVITSGGVSVGEADYTKSILESRGEMHFWRIAMKPGRPLTFGRLGQSLFFGLPGNPVAVMVTFYQFVLPALHTLSGGEPYRPFTLLARSEGAIRKRAGRFEFLRGRLQQTPAGEFSVLCLEHQGSGILTSMSRGDCFILLETECDGVAPGEQVLVQPFAALV